MIDASDVKKRYLILKNGTVLDKKKGQWFVKDNTEVFTVSGDIAGHVSWSHIAYMGLIKKCV